jgi:hypothetical protein
MATVKGFPITPHIIGRIATGHMASSLTGKRLPVKDDYFHITTLVQEKKDDGEWEPHPIVSDLGKANEKLKSIPVRIAYNDPDLNLRNSFSLFDNMTGRLACSGDGVKGRRFVEKEGIQDIECPGPELCAQGQYCKNYSRAYFKIEGQDDELGVFILRTTSWNGLNAIYSTLKQLAGFTGGRIAGMPMALVLATKTTRMSYGEPVYYAKLVQRQGMSLLDAIKAANDYQKEIVEAGLSQEGLEAALREGLQNSDFALEEMPEDLFISDDDLVAVTGNASGLKNLDRAVSNIDKSPPVVLNLPDNLTPIKKTEPVESLPSEQAETPVSVPVEQVEENPAHKPNAEVLHITESVASSRMLTSRLKPPFGANIGKSKAKITPPKASSP